jgi:hypothetical protein
MRRPRSARGPDTGAQRILLGSRSDPPIARPGPVWQCLQANVALQRADEHLHRCGPRAVGECLAEILDQHSVPPSALDLLLAWRRLDPAIIAALGADRFSRRTPLEVPKT